MIKHYLKVALRNLMNFKVHSLISAICLAIGITCFSMMNYFIDAITGKVELSDNNKIQHPVVRSIFPDSRRYLFV